MIKTGIRRYEWMNTGMSTNTNAHIMHGSCCSLKKKEEITKNCIKNIANDDVSSVVLVNVKKCSFFTSYFWIIYYKIISSMLILNIFSIFFACLFVLFRILLYLYFTCTTTTRMWMTYSSSSSSSSSPYMCYAFGSFDMCHVVETHNMPNSI